MRRNVVNLQEPWRPSRGRIQFGIHKPQGYRFLQFVVHQISKMISESLGSFRWNLRQHFHRASRLMIFTFAAVRGRYTGLEVGRVLIPFHALGYPS